MDKMKMFNGVSDAELVRMFAQGRDVALSELVARYFDQARKNAMYVVKDYAEAELMVSDAFMTVSKSIRNGAYTEQGDFRAYLVRTVRFKAMDYYRKNKKQVGDDRETDILQGINTKRSGEVIDFSNSESEALMNGDALNDFLLNGFMAHEDKAADKYDVDDDCDDADDEMDFASDDDRGRLAAEKGETRLTLIEQAVHNLPEMQRDIFCLRQSGVLYAEWKTLQEANDPSLAGREGVKFADIVTILGLKSVNTATSGYQYALKNVKKTIAAKMCAAA